jgi:vacuolar-type H+-ATPase subunit E/Vma4
MSLERLIQEVQARNQAALAAEKRRQDDERSRILRDRDQRIEKLRSEIARQSAADGARERVQRLASAKLEARKRLFEAQERRARAEVDGVRDLLAQFTSSPEYPKVLEGMFGFAVRELGRSVKVAGRADDAALLRTLAGKSYDPAPRPILGGIVVTTADGHRALDLSLDELLRLRENLVREILRD